MNHVPDVINKVVYETMITDRDVHIEVDAIYRNLYDLTNLENGGAIAVRNGTNATGGPVCG